MDSRSILITDPPAAPAPGERDDSQLAWKYLGWAGVLFALLGIADLGIAWYPVRFGTPEWEFGIATTTMQNLPLTVMGLTLMLASGISRGRRAATLCAASILAFLVSIVMVLGIVFTLDVPLALQAVTTEPARDVLRRGMLKTGIQTVVYLLMLTPLAVMGFRHALARNR